MNGGVILRVALVITVTLVMDVIFVNGWTDAPNALPILDSYISVSYIGRAYQLAL